MTLVRPSIAEAAGWLVLAALLVAGLPLFVCMPLWPDVTLYDLAARNVLRGGVHYRDIFDTNLPGMVWLHALVRSLFGWSSEAMRAADAVVVALTTAALALFLGKLGVSRAGRAWFAVAVAAFYPFLTEFCHCQRDTWMLLPAAVALHLRFRQLRRCQSGSPPARSVFRAAAGEGVAWGLAFWIKPHVAVPALFVWLASMARVGGSSPASSPGAVPASPWRLRGADFLGLLCGGLLAALPGVAWLIASGAWPYFWDVLLNWNAGYYTWTADEMELRLGMVLVYFAPWSVAHVLAIPAALAALAQARVWRRRPAQESPAREGRALLAALYLGWLAQAVFLQKGFHYVHAPAVLLALASLASWRFPVGPVFLAWCVAGGLVHEFAPEAPALEARLAQLRKTYPATCRELIPWHPLADRHWPELWVRCWREGSTPELRDRLSGLPDIHCAPGWVELQAVADYLRQFDLKDGELLCWNDSTHPLYLMLNVRPAVRYMHVGTALNIRGHRGDILRDVRAARPRFVVSDFLLVGFYYDFPYDPPAGRPFDLPEAFPADVRAVYPWCEPVVFRAGRYCVHVPTGPARTIDPPYEPEK